MVPGWLVGGLPDMSDPTMLAARSFVASDAVNGRGSFVCSFSIVCSP